MPIIGVIRVPIRNVHDNFMKTASFLPALALLAWLASTPAFALDNNDIGFQQVVDELSDEPDTDIGDGVCKTSNGGCSLRAAIQESNADKDRIWEIQLTAGTISISDGKSNYEIKASVIITGAANGGSILEGHTFSRIFKIVPADSAPVEVLLRNMTLRKGPILQDGGLGDNNGSQVYSLGDLALENVTVTNGGIGSNAVFVDSHRLTINNSRFISNGRAVSIVDGRATISDSRFENNSIRTGGAALLADHSIVEISGSTFQANTSNSARASQGLGGAIQQNEGELTIRSSQFVGNHCVLGGAIHSSGLLFISADVSFSNNSAGRAGAQDPASAKVGDGGALYLAAGHAVVEGVGLTGNSAERAGGAIYVASKAEAELRRLDVASNKAGLLGGGLYFENASAKTVLKQSAVHGNIVLDKTNGTGGGLYAAGGVRLLADLISENQAFTGAGIAASGDNNVIENSTIVLNRSIEFDLENKQIPGAEGAIYFNPGDASPTLTIINATIAGNVSSDGTAAGLVGKNGRILVGNSVIVTTAEKNVLCAGSVASNGNNVASDTSCHLTASGDLEGAADETVRQLADNGGPTLTTAIDPGSKAINHVPAAACPIGDQRAFKRDISDGFCDAGAYESGAAPLRGGVLNFAAVSFLASESAGEMAFTVERTGGSDGSASVDVVDLGAGTAAPGFDYEMTPSTLRWGDGEVGAKSFKVKILDDTNKEIPPNETVALGLLNPEGEADPGEFGRANLTIVDDDAVAYGEFRLDHPRYSVIEKVRDDAPNNQGSLDGENQKTKNNTLSIVIVRTGPTDQGATIGYKTVDDTAIAGKDYEKLDHSITFEPGEAAKLVTLTVLDDDLFEPDETLTFELYDKGVSASPVFFTRPARATITIISDDAKKPDPVPPVRDRSRSATGAVGLVWLLTIVGVAGFRRVRRERCQLSGDS